MILNGRQLQDLIDSDQLVTGYTNLSKQLQPAGVDLCIASVESFIDMGAIDFDNSKRVVAPAEQLEPDEDGWWTLYKGAYRITFQEKVRIPLNAVGISIERSSVMRNGATVQVGHWDPGYIGHGQQLLVVDNPYGIRIQKGARVACLILIATDVVADGYLGIYQHEGDAR